jgi:putative SOS response-associated peptidase YedK
MCGRISYSIPRAELLASYSWLKDAPEKAARYNIAPTDLVLAVGPNSAEVVRWGMEGRKGGLWSELPPSDEASLLHNVPRATWAS